MLTVLCSPCARCVVCSALLCAAAAVLPSLRARFPIKLPTVRVRVRESFPFLATVFARFAPSFIRKSSHTAATRRLSINPGPHLSSSAAQSAAVSRGFPIRAIRAQKIACLCIPACVVWWCVVSWFRATAILWCVCVYALCEQSTRL